MVIEQHQITPYEQSGTQNGWDKRALHIVQQINSQDGLENILQTLVEQVATVLQADRCFIIEFDETEKAQPVRIETTSSEGISSFQGLTPPWGFCPFLKRTERGECCWAEDVLLDKHFSAEPTLVDFANSHSIRGIIATPIHYKDNLLCVLIVHTNEPRAWSEGELLLVQASSAHAAANISQTHAKQSEARYQKLYEWEKKTREVLQTIRQSIDTDKVFPIAIEEMAKALNANRAFIIEFDGDTVCPIRYEYRSHDTVKPFTGIVPPWDFCPYLAVSAKNLMAWSSDTYNDKDFEGNEQWYHFSRNYDIRSIVTAPILYKVKLMNVVVFHTVEPRQWTEQELFFIKVVGDQLSTLFYQEKIREELIRAAQIKSDFLSKMSHELRTPLNSIIGYAKMIEKGMVGPMTEKQEEYIQYVGRSGAHLLNLVNDLLDFSKIEAGKMSVDLEPIDLLAIVSDIMPIIDEQASRNEVAISFQIQPGIGTIDADPQRFKQILLNLIGNAIKFNHPKGTVSIRLNKLDGWMVGEVQDTGIGIPKENVQELFNRFHQIDNSASRKHEGTGLGLVLTKELIELHGGEILVESEEGVGSTFTFKLPVESKVLLES